ncbi:glycosyltransferase family 4 protein [Fodinisporobacter ferrooxydans]|uniref:Glycosyltransferase family 4 protein n=1 Tax=Fodinisporobacter ferrooxydans TaxID=2901836 RepID=A0ABY4CL94_9BACL|nr:glycosyltransferase family 4 protein [Alicyclobacillaceae bacterium MYW30-H2]
MKFTFPILTLCLGGAQRMLAEITNGLLDRGHQVTILMPPQGAVEYEVKAPIIRTKQNYQIAESDYPAADVIVSNFYTTVPEAHAASLNGKGIHIRLSLCYEPVFLPDNHYSFPTYHLTPHVLVLSEWQRDIIRLNHGMQGYIVPVGVNPTFKNLNIRSSGKPARIVAIVRKPEGGFSWHREQAYLLNHLDIVKDRYPNIQITLFCPPNELASSPSLLKLKKQNRYLFYTPGNDIELCYHLNQADLYISASTYDSASLPGLEAMRCGTALITTYAGGNSDYCRHEQNCLMSYRFENRLFEDIIRLIEDDVLRKQLMKEGEKEAAKWTWERSVDAFEAAISKILG